MKKNWILIEDEVERAEGIIRSIRYHCPNDDIYWVFPYSRGYPGPRIFKAELQTSLTYIKGEILPELAQFEGKPLDGFVDFYWCIDEEATIRACEQVLSSNSILVLDVELDALGRHKSIQEPLKSIVINYLNQKEGTLLSMATNVANPFKVIVDLFPDEAMQEKTFGGNYAFSGSKEQRVRDYKTVVVESHHKWTALYARQNVFDGFWGQVGQYKTIHFHNWDKTMCDEITRGNQLPLWDKEWEMPVQLRWLIEALYYEEDRVAFLEELELDVDGEKTRAIKECLKTMGTVDSNGMSPLAVLLVIWMAFRKLFSRNPIQVKQHNHKFIEAIRSCEIKKGEKYEVDEQVCRHGLISPPQSLSTTQKTAKTLYEMMLQLLKDKETGYCTLKNVKFEKEKKTNTK